MSTSADASDYQGTRHRYAVSGPLRKMITGVVLFIAVCLVAVAGYMAAGWRLDDSVYMVVITIFGVGYGEVHPIHSPALRALTIVVIIAGYGAVIYTVGGFMQMVIDGELNKALGARRMTKETERLRNHSIICGVGRMGTILARELHASEQPFVVIDSDESRLAAAEERGYLCVRGDATEERVLERAGIARAATLATVLSDDALNVFVTITARALNPALTIIARGENPRTESKLLGCGADKVVLPTAIGATRVAQLITRPSAEDMLEQLTSKNIINDELADIGLKFDELRIEAESSLVGRVVGDIEVRSNHGFLIVGMRANSGTTTLNPTPSTPLAAGDVVIVIGRKDDIPQLAARFSGRLAPRTYRGAVVDS